MLKEHSEASQGGDMKSTTFCQLVTAGFVSLSSFSPPLFASGPEGLEALAEKAKEAAGDIYEEAKKAPQAPASKPEDAAEPTQAKAPKEVIKKAVAEEAPVDLEKRVEKLGLIANLSPDISAVMTLTNGEQLCEELSESKIGDILFELMADNEVDLTDPESPGTQLLALFKEEFLIASGKGSSKQLENLVSLSGLSNKHQIATMVRLWTMGVNEEDDALLNENPFSFLVDVVHDDPDFVVNLVSAMKMPPILLAARVSDDEKRDEFSAFLEMGVGMALGMGAEEMPFLKGAITKIAGISFNGLSLNGEILVESLQDELGISDMLGSILDPASAQDVLDSLKKKNLVLMGGVSDEVIYLYLGNSVDEIPLVEDVANGLAASEEFAFADAYLDEKLVNVFWMEEDLVQVGANSEAVFGDYIEGIELGLKGNDAVGDTKALKKMLKNLLKLEKDLLAFGQVQSAAAGLSFLRGDGLYSESFGGNIDGIYDWETPHQLGPVESDTFLSVQSVMNPEGNKVAAEYLETAFASVYEMARLMGELESSPNEKAELFLEGFECFDEKMKGDALSLWKGIRASEAGLGNESIFEIDLAGSWPTVPGVPEAIIEKGLAPRISYIAPVTERPKLAESWKAVEGAVARMLQTVSGMQGEDIPMQKPMSSQNEGLKTWFFPIPMQTDDFVPSITLDDELMIMSTSKERAVELAQLAKEKGAGKKGLVMVMNFEPLQAFLSNWFEIVSEDPEAILKDAEQVESFLKNQETFESVIKSLEEFHSLSAHTRMENGKLRSSSHFKTK